MIWGFRVGGFRADVGVGCKKSFRVWRWGLRAAAKACKVDGIWIRQLRVASINCTTFGKLAQVRSAARGRGERGGQGVAC